MTITNRFASILFVAIAPLTACMDATGSDTAGLDVDYPAVTTDRALDTRADAASDAVAPPAGHLIGAKAHCQDGVGTVVAYTTGPSPEVEVRSAAAFRASGVTNQPFVQARESLILSPALHAPTSPTYFWSASIALENQTCDEWKEQLEEVRARFGGRFEIGDLRAHQMFGFQPVTAPAEGDVAPIRPASADGTNDAPATPDDTTGIDGVIYRITPDGEVAPVRDVASIEGAQDHRSIGVAYQAHIKPPYVQRGEVAPIRDIASMDPQAPAGTMLRPHTEPRYVPSGEIAPIRDVASMGGNGSTGTMIPRTDIAPAHDAASMDDDGPFPPGGGWVTK